MAAFGKRGLELLKEVVNHEPDALPSYNVCVCVCLCVLVCCVSRLAICKCKPGTQPPQLHSPQEELVRLVFSEVDEHFNQAQRVLRCVQSPANAALSTMM